MPTKEQIKVMKEEVPMYLKAIAIFHMKHLRDRGRLPKLITTRLRGNGQHSVHADSNAVTLGDAGGKYMRALLIRYPILTGTGLTKVEVAYEYQSSEFQYDYDWALAKLAILAPRVEPTLQQYRVTFETLVLCTKNEVVNAYSIEEAKIKASRQLSDTDMKYGTYWSCDRTTKDLTDEKAQAMIRGVKLY